MTVAEFQERWMQARDLKALKDLAPSQLVDVQVQSTFAGRFFTSFEVVLELKPDDFEILINALEMWIGNEHDDLHEMGDEEPNKASRQERVTKAEQLQRALELKAGW